MSTSELDERTSDGAALAGSDRGVSSASGISALRPIPSAGRFGCIGTKPRNHETTKSRNHETHESQSHEATKPRSHEGTKPRNSRVDRLRLHQAAGAAARSITSRASAR